MIIKLKKDVVNQHIYHLPICWLFKDYFRVVDEKVFFLETLKHGVEFEKIDDTEYEWMLYTGKPS